MSDTARSASNGGPGDDGLVAARVHDWRGRLIDLTYRNRLIRYSHQKASSLAIEAPSVATVLADLERARPWRFFLPPEQDDDAEIEESDTAEFVGEVVVAAGDQHRDPAADELVVTEPSAKRIVKVLDNLAKRSNAEFEDKALRVLYLVVGFLDWVDPLRGQAISSPLVLVPVRLERANASRPYELYFVDDEDIVINPSLTEKLRVDAGLTLDDDWAWEDKPIDVELDEIRRGVAAHGWTVREEAALGLFSFQKYVMYRDLLDNEPVIAAHPIIRALALTRELADAHMDLPSVAELDDVQPPGESFSIRDADATQRFCLEAAARGQSFVMHGPPGTGKSQTIANLIAEAIGRGKKVLFVSEKAAALDVVYDRLAEQDLAEYVLMLHGEHAARREVVHALHASLTSEMMPRAAMGRDGFDRLSQLRGLLNDSTQMLHVDQPALGQWSLRHAYGQLARLHAAPVVPGAPPASDMRKDDARNEFQRLRETFARLAERWRVAGAEFPWRGFAGTSFRDDERATLLAELSQLRADGETVGDLHGAISASLGLPHEPTARAARQTSELLRRLARAPTLEPGWLRHGSADEIASAVERVRAAHDGLVTATAEFAVQHPGLDLDALPSAAQERLTAAIDEVELALGRTSAWGRELIAALPRIGQLASALPNELAEAGDLVSTIASPLGHTQRSRTLPEAARLVELAGLCFGADDRPDPEWLLGPALSRARTVLDLHGERLRAYAQLDATLREDYDREVFALDLRALRGRFRRDWDAEFLEREYGYREDLATLSSARIDGEAPADPAGDLDAFIAHSRILAEALAARAQLLERFSADAFKLDGAELHQRFSGPHTGALARLGKQYRADARAIKAVRPDHKLGDQLLEDLALLQHCQQLEREAEAQQATLLERYRALAFELPHTELAERFSRRYTAAFLARHRDYHADLDALNGVRRSDRISESEVPAELARLTQRQSLGGELDAAEERLRVAFASFYAGRDSDPDAIERALEVAARALELMDRDADVEAVRAQLAVGARPDPQLTRTADQLQRALTTLAAQLDELAVLAALVPGWRETLTLDALGERVQDALATVTPLQAITDELTQQGRRPAALGGLGDRARAADTLREARRTLEEQEPAWRTTLGARYAGAQTPWQELLAAATYLRELEQSLVGKQLLIGQNEQRFVSDGIAARLLGAGREWEDASQLALACDRYDASLERVAAHFDQPRHDELLALGAGAVLATAQAAWAELVDHIDDLRDYIELRRHRRRAADLGWGEFVEHLLSAGVPADEMEAAFERAWWTRRLERLDAQEPDLFADDGATYTRWIGEFRRLDRQLVQTGADRLISARNGHRPALVDGVGSEVAILKGEAGKRRRFRPVRKLLAQMPTLLSELKPCLMMSPLTVSHFLSPQHRFDLVVFDEASQVPPWEAINCIYRGAQLIVAGDSKQLPPTSFFQRAEAGEAFDDDADAVEEDMESVLESCKVLLPEHALKWHYRSRNEQLIAFSNHHIYEDALWTFPGASEAGTRTGIGFVHVADGIYDRGRSKTNRREAQVVAERVVSHLNDATGRSVGVITFNAAQAEAIGEELDRQRIEHPHLEPYFTGGRLDSVFVKHIEAVQGDERDVIVFSIGWGYDRDGKFPMMFGPLGGEGGFRRLNVAITRAREYVEVVSSVQPSDFTLGDGGSRGPQLLRRYLEYARENASERTADLAPSEHVAAARSPFEAEVATVIQTLGYDVSYDVGRGPSRIDLGVHHPDDPARFMLGIVTDGENYASVPTARDRDRLRSSVFEQLGWRLYPIWSIDWINNRREQLQRLEHALAEARVAEPPEPARPSPETAHPEPDAASEPIAAADDELGGERVRRERPLIDVREDPSALPWVHLYECAELTPVDSLYEFADVSNQRRQVEMVIEVANVEAPVHTDQLARRLAEAYGVERVTQGVQTAVKRAVEKASRQGLVERRGEFVWRRGQAMPPIRTPDPDDPRSRRDIDEIACLELTSALVRMRKASPGAELEHLIPQAARVFGIERTSARIRDRFLDCLRRVTGDLDALAEDG